MFDMFLVWKHTQLPANLPPFLYQILDRSHSEDVQCKVCVLDLVQLEDDICYIKSSDTDLSSYIWTRSKTQTL